MVVSAFAVSGLAVYAAVVVVCARWRSRFFAIFVGVVLGIPTLVGIALRPEVGAFWWALPYLQVVTVAHLLALVFVPGMRAPWVRALVSIPAMWWVATTFLAIPWAVAAALGFDPVGTWLPFALGIAGLWQSLWTREETVKLRLDNDLDVGPLRRHPQALRGEHPPDARPLRIVQITDPHLGPFMSVARLRRICARAVARKPDLVLLTGDFLTMESHDVDVLAQALEPLAAMRGRVFACHGNHDLEARAVVAAGLRRVGVTLLVDDGAVVETAAGPVQVVGFDHVWRGRAGHVTHVCETFPRRDGAMRMLLIHDPGVFRHLPPGESDLVLSGHTHGGQVGFVSLGLPLTILSLLSKMPDHGLWARGRDRLYVHRATGHYGFPLRLGVPGEQSLMEIHRSRSPR